MIKLHPATMCLLRFRALMEARQEFCMRHGIWHSTEIGTKSASVEALLITLDTDAKAFLEEARRIVAPLASAIERQRQAKETKRVVRRVKTAVKKRRT